MNATPFTIDYETDPVRTAEFRQRMMQFDRNLEWLEAHAAEVYSHRGKIVCIAGQELFVGDEVMEVVERAKIAHPDDAGLFTRIIPKDRGPRVYAC